MWLALALSTQLLRPAVVLDPVATMYSKPDALADVVSQAIYGTQVRILEEQEGWAKVETPDEYMGWMPLAAVRGLRDGEAGYATSGRVARVESLFANLYREPDVTLHEPLLTVPFETRLEVNAEPADDGARWIRVSLVDGELAWIARGDVIFDPPHLTPADLPALSKRFLGLPYLWGGTSTYGYDCSGLVQMLYRRLGVLLPRDAQPQAAFKGFAAVERKLNAYYAEFQPLQANKARLHHHSGVEFLSVLCGKLELHIGTEDHVLESGDSIYFDSSLPHSYRRIGQKQCGAIVVTAP